MSSTSLATLGGKTKSTDEIRPRARSHVKGRRSLWAIGHDRPGGSG